MWYQKDWFTGSDYYNFRERQISVQELCIINPVEQVFHERTEIYYVRSGKATIWVNGEKFKVRQGSLLCLYMHLLRHPLTFVIKQLAVHHHSREVCPHFQKLFSFQFFFHGKFWKK